MERELLEVLGTCKSSHPNGEGKHLVGRNDLQGPINLLSAVSVLGVKRMRAMSVLPRSNS